MAERADDTASQTAVPAPSAQPPEPDVARLVYHGSVGPLAVLSLTNLVLTALTLGIYRFWARTRFRAYFWRNVSFLGDRFEYTGKGLELFLGFLIALGVIIPLGLVSQAIPFLIPFGVVYPIVAMVLFIILIYFLIGFATYRARRYRLSRTTWRGIRAGQTGSSVRFGLMWLFYFFLSIITLGLAAPLGTVRLQQFAMGNTWFGDKQIQTSYSASKLFKRWFLYWLFLLPSFGLTYVWYSAAKFRYLAGNTRLDQLKFTSDLKGGRLFRIFLVYGLIMSAAFGVIAAVYGEILSPVIRDLAQAGNLEKGVDPTLQALRALTLQAQITLITVGVVGYLAVSIAAMVLYIQPLIRAVAESVQVTVRQDFSTLQQSTQPAPRRGEGLADSFDLSGF